RLPCRQSFPDNLDQFGTVDELVVIDGVVGFDVREIEDIHMLGGELAPVRFGLGIDGAEPGVAAPDPAREREGLVPGNAGPPTAFRTQPNARRRRNRPKSFAAITAIPSPTGCHALD